MVEGLDKIFAATDSVIASGAKALACLPLRGIPEDSGAAAMLGILYLDSTHPMHALSGLDEKILKKLARDAGNVLERIEFVKGAQQRKTLERELALAEETQKALLPSVIPVVPGWQLAAFSKPTRYVGGDFYDFLQSPGGALVGVLGDVAGKGVSAALISSMILGSTPFADSFGPTDRIGGSRGESIDVREVIREPLRDSFCRGIQRRRVRTIHQRGPYDGISVSRIHWRRGRTSVELHGGRRIFDFAVFECNPTNLGPGDLIISYSDGLTEAENPAGRDVRGSTCSANYSRIRTSGAEAVNEN